MMSGVATGGEDTVSPIESVVSGVSRSMCVRAEAEVAGCWETVGGVVGILEGKAELRVPFDLEAPFVEAAS